MRSIFAERTRRGAWLLLLALPVMPPAAPARTAPAGGAAPESGSADPASAAPAGPATSLQGEPPEPYHPAPFVKGLSPRFRSNPAGRMGVASLAELPLYQMEIELDPVRGILQGHQELVLTNRTGAPLGDVVLRTYPNAPNVCPDDRPNLTVSAVRLDGVAASHQAVNRTAVRVPLAAPLQAGGRVRLGVDYRARVPRLSDEAVSPSGGNIEDLVAEFHGKQSKAGYGIYASAVGVFNLGFFYPLLPARVGGDWDTAEPAGMGDVANFGVANYLVRLRVPKTMVVASSGVQVGEKMLGPGPGDKKDVFLLGTGLRHFALQLSTRYVVREKKVGPVRVRWFHVREHAADADAVLAKAASALGVYQKMFGPYPWPGLDVAEAPLTGGAGGMEYPGLVTVAMALTGRQAGSPTDALLQQVLESTGTVEFVLAHEIAHQWWHALVGSDSSRHPFLDESLANYSAVMYFEARHGQDAAARQLGLQLAMPYRVYRMMGGADGRVDRPVDAFSSQLAYAALVYGKGALFYNALRRKLGRKRFVRMLRRYARRHAFRRVDPDDLLQAARGAGARPAVIERLYRRWIEQAHGDEDIGGLDLGDLDKLLGQLGALQGISNIKIDGRLDPATLKMLQDAVRQLTGGP